MQLIGFMTVPSRKAISHGGAKNAVALFSMFAAANFRSEQCYHVSCEANFWGSALFSWRLGGFNSRVMAKKKPTKPKTTKAPLTTKARAPRRAAAKPVDTALERAEEGEIAVPTTPDPAPAVPREAGTFNGVEIGHAAGDVWGVLSRGEPLTVAAIKKEVAAPGDVVVAAIGWLAREDKLAFDTAGRAVKISLR
jgi:hypothetical protein